MLAAECLEAFRRGDEDANGRAGALLIAEHMMHTRAIREMVQGYLEALAKVKRRGR